ncbi:hypothetical protein GYMLUDRAFT_252080 [Collybiopsis luxurians FD-317 M1]|uniref:Transmembrane protein n=1 Tax=Collybiopsis luxurians FD-317 M1 TaxID=944289 RepID=A0A0D0AMB8_9AGAR|nr:hypothetical protein GYMLUDRAFT_252080 [Collybiopsis luxurians FD-317 M1]
MIIPSTELLRDLAARSSTTGVEATLSAASSQCKDIDKCRTLLQIIWSCVSVLVACTWVSVHPNVPGPDEGFWKILRRKIGLMMIALIAPELVVLWAARQWFAARKLAKRYREQGWTRTHAFFALMGGFALYEDKKCVSVLRFIPSEEAIDCILDKLKKIEGRSDVKEGAASVHDDNDDDKADIERDTGVSISPNNDVKRHSRTLTLRAGGRLGTGVPISNVKLSAGVSFSWSAALEISEMISGVRVLSEDASNERSFAAHVDVIGRMSEHHVKDRGHSDGFAKFVAVGQTTWFVVQLLARWVEGLPVTELEIMTLAFAAMNVLIYYFWWDKPQGVECHVGIPRKEDRGSGTDQALVATQHNEEQKWETTSKDATDRPVTPMQESSEGRWLHKRLRHGLHTVCKFFGKDYRKIGMPHFTLLVIGWIILAPFSAVNDTIFIHVIEDLDKIPSERVSSFERTIALEPRDADDKIIAYSAAVMFGGIHCAAWASKYPSTTEEVLWRVCSLLVTCIPICLVFFVVTAGISKPWKFCLRLGGSVLVHLYILARLSLIVQSFLALRDLPSAAFEAVQWTNFIPHI